MSARGNRSIQKNEHSFNEHSFNEHSFKERKRHTMFENELHENEARQRPGWHWVSLLLGGIIIVAGILLLAWQIAHPAPPANRSSTATISGEQALKQSGGQTDPPIYWQTLQEQVAQGLHLTVAQMKAQLQPPPGQRDSLGIAHVAAEQGISPAKLRIIELNAIQ